jgi:hypothetical protein
LGVIRTAVSQTLPFRTVELAPLPPALIERRESLPASGPPRRTKIWELNTNLHCSVIGTCLSTAELRQLLKKLGLATPDSTDHDLHGIAVGLAGRHDKAAKLLHKALDERHRLAISQFGKATAEDGLRSLWREAVRSGDIPGAYWAALTHPSATRAVVREAFGEVHMLSHLVGAANRADIRRLRELEAANGEMLARLDRQQIAFRDAVVTRDATIADLRQTLARQVATGTSTADADPSVMQQLIADLERRLAAETRRGAALAERLESAKATIAEERAARTALESENRALRRELDAIETSLQTCGDQAAAKAAPPRLDGLTLLYVGGYPNQVAHLRDLVEAAGAGFLHHDGGVEHHLNLLAGLASQANLVVFPVDCISHHAAHVAKQLCRQTRKRLIPLRSASATSLLAALRRPEVVGLADAAD